MMAPLGAGKEAVHQHFFVFTWTTQPECVSHPSSEVKLCVSVKSSVGIGGGGGSMSTRCSDAE